MHRKGLYIMEGFRLDAGVLITGEYDSEPLKGAVNRFYRDIDMALETKEDHKTGRQEIVLKRCEMEAESFIIRVRSASGILIEVADDLGFIYAFLYISSRYLGIRPFWFWNDQKFVKIHSVLIPASEYRSVPKPVKYRGCFC